MSDDLKLGTGTGQQSQTTDSHKLDLLKHDVQRIVIALETLVVQTAGLKTQLASIEKTIVEIALGLGVTPK